MNTPHSSRSSLVVPDANHSDLDVLAIALDDQAVPLGR